MKLHTRLCLAALIAALFTSAAPAAPREPWLSATPLTTNTLRGVTFGDGLFVAVGDQGTILTSTDGANWTARTAGTNPVNLYAVALGAAGFVAVGGTREAFSQPIVWTSTNGLVWAPRDVAAQNLTWGNWLQAVTYGGGLYVAAGGNYTTNTVLTSPDGAEWTMRDTHLINSGLIPLSAVAYGNGVFVAAGAWLITSQDGITWTEQDASEWYRLYAMTFAAGRFVGVGPYSRICSTNGTDWLIGTPPTGDYINGVAYGDGDYLCVGSSPARPAYTTNGTNWLAQTNPLTANAIAYGNSVFVAVGPDGNIYRTASAMHLRVQAAPPAQLTLTALVPGTCYIESSSNLADTNAWTPLATVPLANSPTSGTDFDSTNVPVRFYRATWSP